MYLDAPPLFPLIVCECGHRQLGVEPGDPCPACLVSPDDEHDCLLRVAQER